MPKPIVIKLGGSLLPLPGLSGQLAKVLGLAGEESVILIVGGGPVAQFVRKMHCIHRFSDVAAHWQAMRSLVHNSQLLTCVVENTEFAATLADCHDIERRGKVPVLDTYRFLADQQAQGRSIPAEWEFTSDSIAALVADACGGQRLWLLKSVDLPLWSNPQSLASAGLVDARFPDYVARLHEVQWINLRAQDLRLSRIVPPPE